MPLLGAAQLLCAFHEHRVQFWSPHPRMRGSLWFYIGQKNILSVLFSNTFPQTFWLPHYYELNVSSLLFKL